MPPDARQRLRTYWLTGATLLSLVCYYQLIYRTAREDFVSIIFYFLVLTMVYLLVVRVINRQTLVWALGASVLLRLSLIAAIPELSDDFYRFIWDGRLLIKGISPYAALPSTLMQDASFNQHSINQLLYQGMNSPDYFTVYPPLSQWIFSFAAWCFPDNIQGNLILIRAFIILFETGSLVLSTKIIRKYGLSENKVLIYAWNPLVIMELTGNLHFEAVMIFFVLLAVYLLQENRLVPSALAMAAGVAVKLVPLIFLPLLAFRDHWKKVMLYWSICAVTVAGFFLTTWSGALWEGLSSSLTLYFQKFEFNASIYYLVREIGFSIKGHNIIQTAGPILALITFVSILLLSRHTHKSMKWPQAMVWALTIYLLMATTVHPWYITTLVALAVFTNYWFPVAWSILTVLSYAGYTETGFAENMFLVIVEYLSLVVIIFWDLRNQRVVSPSYTK